MIRTLIYELLKVVLLLTLTAQAFPTDRGRRLIVAEKADNGNSKNSDPCEQLLAPKGNANGLHERCEAIGTGGGVARGDFNGDGLADIAVGVPNETELGATNTGIVNVMLGSAAGLASAGNQTFSESDFGLDLRKGDHFGSALASGDFNGDGFSDLAIGIPDREEGTFKNAGRVVVVNGSPGGLNKSTASILPLLSGGQGRAGAALVWADFNGDGFGDLAVGIPDKALSHQVYTVVLPSITPGCRIESIPNAGEVQVFYGSMGGLSQTGAQSLTERLSDDFHCSITNTSPGVGGIAGDGDKFGSVLAAGDFNHDLMSDLVIGVPMDDRFKDSLFYPYYAIDPDVGAVFAVPGGSLGLVLPGAQRLLQGDSGVEDKAEVGDQFGRSVATGDFNGDQRDDLAVGIPFEDVVGKADAGAVQTFFGFNSRSDLLDPATDLFISQDNIVGAAETGDRFGWSLAAGRFDLNLSSDLAIGVPGEDLGSIEDAGIVEVLYGSSSGPSLTNTQIWSQDSTGVPDAAEAGDQFGYSLSAWNYGRTPQADLAIGVPFEDVFSSNFGTQQGDAGAVNIIYGSPVGLAANSNGPQFWTQDSSGILDLAEAGDHFGEALY